VLQQTQCVNQIEEVCQDIERTINRTVQNTLNTLEQDCETIVLLLEKRLEQDSVDCSYNFKNYSKSNKNHIIFFLTSHILLIMLYNACIFLRGYLVGCWLFCGAVSV
jgi:hypothetical protein